MSRNLSEYWGLVCQTKNGWVHPDDDEFLSLEPHSFNLDFPPPAFVGDVTNANVIILVANGGYKPDITPREFENPGAETKYLNRIAFPAQANWSEVAPYYQRANYADLVFSGKAAVVNACAYRSPKISSEPENRRLLKRLPSVQFNRNWLIETIWPEAESGKRLIVGKRHGLWDLPAAIKNSSSFIADPAPVSPHLSQAVWERLGEYSSDLSRYASR